MGFGVLRYTQNKVVAVIDPDHAGGSLAAITKVDHPAPIVNDIDESIERGQCLGHWYFSLGGKNSQRLASNRVCHCQGTVHCQWVTRFTFAQIQKQFKSLAVVWDVRVPRTPQLLPVQAMELNNRRILFIGTDMAAGKMTAGLELYHWLREEKPIGWFVATGQIGITVTGQGIPLDAFKVDLACGAVEEAVLQQRDKEILLIEGQGSLLHRRSTCNTPFDARQLSYPHDLMSSGRKNTFESS